MNINMNTKTKLSEYHICYVKDDTNCTGVNIKATDYGDAYKKFDLQFKNKKIIYICIK